MTKTLSYSLFETAIGACAIAWGEHGITAVSLPEAHATALRSRFAKRFPEAQEDTPTAAIGQAIARIQALLKGEADDLADIPLDDADLPAFNKRVYAIARRIPPGATRTYGEIARELGDPLLAQSVGQALGRNPFPIIVPCHRVLAAGGKTGGFSATGGIETKFRMLAIERAKTDNAPSLFDELPLSPPPRRSH
ncbi:methylated-DNA--[protein]-cysteine S-methyltransferase [Taklimakanibacter lacteus]|uniref:methylated-DNA--[protein]-cysteine S-methyltransferase n=1 Tax=Taklimakanibacter lacteus TaxID=2268456 RepID=UPI000E661630